VATLLDPEFGAWFEAEYLRQLESTSIPFTIGEAENEC
jgi:hypothetical protein